MNYICHKCLQSYVHFSSFPIDSCAVKLDSIQLKHGFQLSFKLLKEAQSLEFSALNGKVQYTIWSSSVKPKKGQVTGWGNDKRFIIKSVTFDDQGNYTQKSLKRTVLVNVKVKECVAGETLKIPLRGLTSRQATLDFYSHDLNLTLVDHGLPIGKSHPNYYERLKVTTETIEVLNVSVSDMGNYTLQDDRGRKVLMVIMKLVDHHEKKLNPLVALMLLLGIPAGVCCCCRKRIFKKSGHPTTTTNVQSGNLIPPPGPPPSYNTVVDPAVPGLVRCRTQKGLHLLKAFMNCSN
uniref:Immunoglobulin V-set domain-containing protein n=1 Tax=Electrophorus electricus TaxID=8005 RepID=A0AAY5EN75_ELEEL